MSTLFVFLLLSALFLPSSSSSSDLFGAWCKQHGKTYSSDEEWQYRKRVFEDNLAFVTTHNQLANSSYTLSLNALADLSHHEFITSLLGLAPPPAGFLRRNAQPPLGAADLSVPDEVDWRKNGAVTNVKDQSSCGACWSFSTTGAIEGINKIVTGSLVSLSEQELIDCDRTYNSGCEGGLMDYAYQFVIKNHGIDTEEDYPYEGKQNTCNKEKLKKHVITIDGYSDVPYNNEKALLSAVATQPVSVGICGSERAFQLYSKGIFSGPCSNNLDHAVLIVGYGSENGVDYWIVKNSWGPHWGMSGYIYMQRNTGNVNGLCGINMLASYPTKTKPNPPSPPTPPHPTQCDYFSSCPEGSTCCCAWSVLRVCLRWKCCQLESAVCCNDGLHCCPQDHPICDTKRNACLKVNGNFTSLKELGKKQDSYLTFRGQDPLLGALNM